MEIYFLRGSCDFRWQECHLVLANGFILDSFCCESDRQEETIRRVLSLFWSACPLFLHLRTTSQLTKAFSSISYGWKLTVLSQKGRWKYSHFCLTHAYFEWFTTPNALVHQHRVLVGQNYVIQWSQYLWYLEEHLLQNCHWVQLSQIQALFLLSEERILLFLTSFSWELEMHIAWLWGSCRSFSWVSSSCFCTSQCKWRKVKQYQAWTSRIEGIIKRNKDFDDLIKFLLLTSLWKINFILGNWKRRRPSKIKQFPRYIFRQLKSSNSI